MIEVTRMLRVLALALWVGGIFFFAVGVAPVAFHVLPSSHEAGLVVASSLGKLHLLGLICGCAYVCTGLRRTAASAAEVEPTGSSVSMHGTRMPSHWNKLLSTSLVLLMLALTCASQYVVVPRMERDRAMAAGNISSLAVGSVIRSDFDRLHQLSELLESLILLLGITALGCTTVATSPQSKSRHQ